MRDNEVAVKCCAPSCDDKPTTPHPIGPLPPLPKVAA